MKKRKNYRDDLGQHRSENSSIRPWIRRGAISCSPHTSFDGFNDSVVKSKRGNLVRGSDPLLGYNAHSTAGDLWRAPIRLLLGTHLAAGVQKTETKLSIVSQRVKTLILRGSDGRPQDNTSNLSRPRAWMAR